MKYIEETLKTPIKKECDVFVAGGGFAGVSAALAAARMGKRVILCEKTYMLGGLGTAGLVIIFLPLCDGLGNQLSYGISEELIRLSVKYGAESEYQKAWFENGSREERKKTRFYVRFNPAELAISTEQLLLENGVEIMYGSMICGAYSENGVVKNAIIENKSGRSAIFARSFVDATGDLDLGVMLGLPYKTYDKNILAAWHYALENGRGTLKIMGASDSRDEKKLVKRLFGGYDADELSEMTYLTHKFILDKVIEEKAKNSDYTPVTIPTIPQVRMTRRLLGAYTMDEEEVGKSFIDSIGMVGDWRKSGPRFEIPFRTLYCDKMKNYITAGRSISVSESMWDITRVIGPCCITGEAAGTAAALTDDFSSLSVEALQKEIRKNGGRCHFSEI